MKSAKSQNFHLTPLGQACLSLAPQGDLRSTKYQEHNILGIKFYDGFILSHKSAIQIF
jgi:hypothetical protein